MISKKGIVTVAMFLRSAVAVSTIAHPHSAYIIVAHNANAWIAWKEKIFATLLILGPSSASIIILHAGWRRGIYWSLASLASSLA